MVKGSLGLGATMQAVLIGLLHLLNGSMPLPFLPFMGYQNLPLTKVQYT
ncbi:hypothetical protein NC651_016256 [Populus alba x Populus x berolinensis]|nr:hypothetical protein NC651_016256 [Populus alba x Populus x berolinensis]